MDWIGNLLEHFHHQNVIFLILGRGMSNLLEMLTRGSETKISMNIAQSHPFRAQLVYVRKSRDGHSGNPKI